MRLIKFIAVCFISGCTTGRYEVETPAVTVTQFPKLNKFRAVLLMPKDKIADTYVTKLKGDDKVEFKNVRNVMETILSTKLKPVFKDLKIVMKASDATNYDYLIAPVLTVKYKDILFRNRILINFDIVTFDSTGKKLDEIKSYEGRTFGGDNGGEAFRLAMETIFDKTIDKVLAGLASTDKPEISTSMLERAKACQKEGGIWINNGCVIEKKN